MLRQYAWVRPEKGFWKDMDDNDCKSHYKKLFGTDDEIHPGLIYFGEIQNMPGHGIFYSSKTKQMICGLHIEDYEEVPEDDC